MRCERSVCWSRVGAPYLRVCGGHGQREIRDQPVGGRWWAWLLKLRPRGRRHGKDGPLAVLRREGRDKMEVLGGELGHPRRLEHAGTEPCRGVAEQKGT